MVEELTSKIMLFGEILFSLWFFLPVGIANCAPIFASHIPFLKNWSYPLDCYLYFRGKRLLGDHKTVRGIITGILSAIFVIYLQIFLYKRSLFIQQMSPIDYKEVNPIIFGVLTAIGALGGDGVKSFLKRQLGIPPGKTWFPFDQLDYVIGGILLTSISIPLDIATYVTIVVVWFALHLIASFLGYILKLKQKPI